MLNTQDADDNLSTYDVQVNDHRTRRSTNEEAARALVNLSKFKYKFVAELTALPVTLNDEGSCALYSAKTSIVCSLLLFSATSSSSPRQDSRNSNLGELVVS